MWGDYLGAFKVSKMRYTFVFILALFATAVNAHFRLQFPPPRGEFNAANEVNFCGTSYSKTSDQHIILTSFVADSYTTPAANRTQFPLSNGYFTLRTGHGHWICASDFLTTLD